VTGHARRPLDHSFTIYGTARKPLGRERESQRKQRCWRPCTDRSRCINGTFICGDPTLQKLWNFATWLQHGFSGQTC